jgi:hypothetical protein
MACLLLLGLSPQAASAADDVTFRITASWTESYVESRRRSVQRLRTFQVTLKANGSITERIESGLAVREADAVLGAARGDRGSTTWKVVNETTLVRLHARDSYTFAIWLRTQGKNSCTATLEWRLKPGFAEYQVRSSSGKIIKLGEPSSPYARCDVL